MASRYVLAVVMLVTITAAAAPVLVLSLAIPGAIRYVALAMLAAVVLAMGFVLWRWSHG